MAAEFPQQLGLGIEHVRHAASEYRRVESEAEHLLDELKASQYATLFVWFRCPEVNFSKGGLHGGCRKSRV
jgi:hypothetical protein